MDSKENIIPEDKKLFNKDEFSEYIKLKTEMEILKRFYDNYPIKYWDARRGFYYTVQASVWLWNNGITPSLINNSYHLQNYR